MLRGGKRNANPVSISSIALGMESKQTTSPLIIFQSHSLFESWIERNRVRTLLVQMSENEVPHSGVELPDPGRHDRDGERCFVVGGHLLLPLFLGAQRGDTFKVMLKKGLSGMHQPRLPKPSATTFLTTNFSASLYWTKSRPCGLSVTDTERPPD